MFFPFVAQESNNDCALACLAMLYESFFQMKMPLSDLKEQCQLQIIEGINLNDLIQLSAKYQIGMTAYRLKFEELLQLDIKKPIMLQVKNEFGQFHFIIIYRKKKHKSLIADPSDTEIKWITNQALMNQFTGILIIAERIKVDKVRIKPDKQQKLVPQLQIFRNPYFWGYFCHLLINNLFLIILFFLAQVIYKNLLSSIMIYNQLALTTLLLFSFLVLNLFHIIVNFLLAKGFQGFYCYLFQELNQKFYHHWFDLLPRNVELYRDSYYLQLQQDINNIAIVFSNNILEVVTNFLTFSFASWFLIKISFSLWGTIFLAGACNLLISWLFMRWQKPRIVKNTKMRMLFHNSIIKLQQNFTDYYFRNLLPIIKNQIVKQQVDLLESEIILKKMSSVNSFFHNLLHHITNFVLMFLLITFIFQQKLVFNDLLFVNTLSIYLFAFFYQIGSFGYFYPEFQKSWKRLDNFFNLSTKTKKINEHESFFNQLQLKLINVNYGFINNQIFADLQLTIQGHQLLLGTNGIGKTTLLQLIARKYQPQKGQIMINNQPIMNLSDEAWQTFCLLLTANSCLINGTILDNLFSFDSEPKKLLKLQQLQIVEILAMFKLTLTMQYSIEQDNLSQGQKQIILFLSLFFRNWKILLLDEVLSNVTVPLKLKLVMMLKNHFPNSIIILATHDKNLCTLFPQVIELEQVKYAKDK